MIEDQREKRKNFVINSIKEELNLLNKFKKTPEFRRKFKQDYMENNFGINGFYSKQKTRGSINNE